MPPRGWTGSYKNSKKKDQEDDGLPSVQVVEVLNNEGIARYIIHSRLDSTLMLAEDLEKRAGKASKVVYKPAKDQPWGRLYAMDSLQSAPKVLRELALSKTCAEIDMVNARGAVLANLAIKYGLDLPALTEYGFKRQELFQRWPGMDKTNLKRLFLQVTNLSMPQGQYEPDLKSFMQELLANMTELKDKLYQDAAYTQQKEYSSKKDDPFASFLTQVFFTYERKMLDLLSETCREAGGDVCVLMHDGLAYTKNLHVNPDDIILSAKQQILDQLGFKIDFHVDVFDDWSRAVEEHVKRPIKYNTVVNMVRACCVIEDTYANCRRNEDDVYTQVPGHPYAYKYLGSLDSVIQTAMTGAPFLKMVKGAHDSLVKWAVSSGSKNIFGKIDFGFDEYASFTNGLLSLRTMELVQNPPKDTTTLTYFDVPYTAELQEAKLVNWDKLIDAQLTKEVEKEFFEALLGRLLFPVDNLQICVCIWGQANTGKSVVDNIIRKLFPKNSVGIISDRAHGTFNLEEQINKRITICSDLPEDPSIMLSRQQFLTIVTQNGVTAQIRYKKAKTVNLGHLLFIGNVRVKYNDSKGEIARRIVYFGFNNEIGKENYDINIEEKIYKDELPGLYVRLCAAYINLKSQMEDSSIWDFAPASCLDEKEEVMASLNPLESFMNGVSQRCTVLKTPGSSVSMDDFKKKFKQFQEFEFEKPKGTPYKSVSSTDLQRYGFFCQKIHWCKECDKKSTVINCGEHFRKNYSKKVFIQDMELVVRDKAGNRVALDWQHHVE
jgi:hypothetical protein